MMHSEQNEKLKTYFEEFIFSINNSYFYGRFNSEKIKIYFRKCYEDLLNESKNMCRVNKVTFAYFLDFPLFISNKIYYVIKKSKEEGLSQDDFIEGLYQIFFGTFDEMINFSFKILDFIGEGKIIKENVLLYLNYMNGSTEENKFTQIEIEEILNKFFNAKSKFSLEEYKDKIINENSDLFVIIIIFMYSRAPFTGETLKFFIHKYIFSNYNQKLETIEENKAMIKIPNSELNEFIESNQNKLKNNNKNDKNSKIISTIFSNEDFNFLSLNTTNNENNYNEFLGYKINSSNKLIKHKLILIDNYLFTLKYSILKNNFFIEEIFNLKNYFYSECYELNISNFIHYPLALIDKKRGDIKVNILNLFFFKDKHTRENLCNKLKEVSRNNNKEIKNFYEFKEDLGEGQFGKVKLALEINSGKKVAVKIIDKNRMCEISIELVKNEIDLMKFFIQNKNENIVNIYDVFEDKKSIYIVMEYMMCGTLEEYVTMKHLNEDELKTLVKQIASGIEFLNKFGIIHRDLKPDNILICDDGINFAQIKITDFGLSKVLGIDEVTSEGYGTLIYTAPEILFRKPYNHKVDIWSFGIIIYYLLTCMIPFDGDNLSTREVAKRICFDEIEQHNLNLIENKEAVDLVVNCLHKDKNERVDVRRIMECKWFIN